jgi:hypothetical protein
MKPTAEGLESRELLSIVHGSAEVSVMRTHHASHPPTILQLATAPVRSASTVPANGDVNPYGIVFIPHGFAGGGVLAPGDILVSNFNNSANLQGTGTSIMRITASNQVTQFYQGPPGVGLSTALGVLKRGFVLVGSVSSTDGTSATAAAGPLVVLNKNGQVVAQFSNPTLLNGPWDLTVNDLGDFAQIFVSNVLSGTVSRFNVALGHNGGFKVLSAVQIASGYTHRGDPMAFEIGPTGLAFDAQKDILYVASTGDNAIYALHGAGITRTDLGTGRVIYSDAAHLRGPLGLTFAPDGNLITANGDVINGDPNQPSELVEFTRHGQFVGQFSINANQGAAFGVATQDNGNHFAAVNDATNMVTIWTIAH